MEVLRSTFKPFWTPRLGIGVMMSYKTLNGIETKWSEAFPANSSIRNIWVDDPDAYNVLHYADYANNPLLPNLEKAMVFAEGCDAIQLDMVWPNPHDLLDFRSSYPDTKIIIQVNSKALERCWGNREVAGYLQMYGDTIDVALLDMSMGSGRSMDPLLLQELAEQIIETCPHLSIAAAGGLGPETLHLADPLFVTEPALSIDAQSKLRPSGNALDPLDTGYCERYLRGAGDRYGKILYDNRI